MDSGSKGPRSRPGQINVLSSRERHLTLTGRLPGKTTIQYNTIFILPYTTFTDGKKEMKKIDDRK